MVLDLLVGGTLPESHPLRALKVSDLDFTSSVLVNLTSAALHLGRTPVQSLTYADGRSWCQLLDDSTDATCAGLGVSSTTTLLELDVRPEAAQALEKEPLLRRPPVARNLTTFRANAAPLLTAPLHQAGLEVSEVGEVSLGRAIAVSAAVAGRPADGDFTPRTVACGLAGFTCTGSTLQQALAQGAVFPATSLSDLGGALSALDVDDVAAAFPEDLDVNDVVLGFLEAEDYPWEQLDLVGSGVQEFDPSPEVVTYTIAADPAGEGPFHGSISATLPVGARFAPWIHPAVTGIRR